MAEKTLIAKNQNIVLKLRSRKIHALHCHQGNSYEMKAYLFTFQSKQSADIAKPWQNSNYK